MGACCEVAVDTDDFKKYCMENADLAILYPDDESEMAVGSDPAEPALNFVVGKPVLVGGLKVGAGQGMGTLKTMILLGRCRVMEIP